MEVNITQQDRSRVEVPLTEPHFDEEATLLSARPVVPLEEVKAEARSRRRLVFVFSILIAVAAGALSSTLLYKYRSQKSVAEVERATPVSEQPSDQNAAVANAGGARIDSHSDTLSATDEKASETVAAEPSDRGTSTSGGSSTPAAPRAVERAATRDHDAESRGDDRIARDNGDDTEHEMRREERKEARRLRREAQREARRGRDTADDLLRIREIFEGAPKP